MLFEFKPREREYCVTFNGENPDEVVRILRGIGYVTTDPPIIVTNQGFRSAEGKLALGVELDSVRAMVESSLSDIPEADRTANNESLQYFIR
jgi:hypothetical protein